MMLSDWITSGSLARNRQSTFELVLVFLYFMLYLLGANIIYVYPLSLLTSLLMQSLLESKFWYVPCLNSSTIYKLQHGC